MKKTQFEIEYLFRASPTIIYTFITTPACLIRWFCEEADVDNDLFTFRWKDSEETAILVDDFEDELLRFRWEDAVSDNEFLEFILETSPVTEETILRLIGWAEPIDHQFQIDFWNNQMKALKKAMGES
ncbi:MAG: activator of HSP90 ATPase 1 family protein [Saprospiraceae bacterium]|uniref:START-like domain-containing protein n=1 Tax=Candidatus Brachybacter algidus TaxID=2982024 RepID=UPI001DCBBEDC|nr:START-like domain-containing protein [Candidatus Brachybacter algidus]HQW72069.1 START-like domain-containing protein [Saprospiraceae bacterium]MBK6448992.1 activator of HSP90 ATPase 1 family protein [Candidatus Brachybacter algidus]MBK7605602.1 activator of HSP90 ATPase 1 family protein [Candidatus Brachybacter algidus]MBK8357359.1 activator of HSP90 ATPase 1 family protein [Candidatus Brachybacter algidus]MBK8604227.1 activator of HSP90 ATPase 1 family protein [Candidatus Brachybacter alg